MIIYQNKQDKSGGNKNNQKNRITFAAENSSDKLSGHLPKNKQAKRTEKFFLMILLHK